LLSPLNNSVIYYLSDYYIIHKPVLDYLEISLSYVK